MFPSLEDWCPTGNARDVPGKVEVFECDYGRYMIRYTRWSKGADRYGYLNAANPGYRSSRWWIEGHMAGRTWKSFEDDPAESQPYQWSAAYRYHPFSVSVEGVDESAPCRRHRSLIRHRPEPNRPPMTDVPAYHEHGLQIFGGDSKCEYLPNHSPIVVGRAEAAGLRVSHDLVSRRHVQLVYDGGWVLEDLHSTNGTWRGGERVSRLALTGDVRVRLGDPHDGPELRLVARDDPARTRTSLTTDRRCVIGRDPNSWLPVDDPMASWKHAAIERNGSEWVIEDLRSTNQTVVNGSPVSYRRLAAGDRVLIGNSTLEFDGGGLSLVTGSRFAVEHASLSLKDGRRIVDDVSFAMSRPSLVAVIGPSGAGKSSLLRLVTGQLPPTHGSVSLDGATMTSQRRAHRGRIGVVPKTPWPTDLSPLDRPSSSPLGSACP